MFVARFEVGGRVVAGTEGVVVAMGMCTVLSGLGIELTVRCCSCVGVFQGAEVQDRPPAASVRYPVPLSSPHLLSRVYFPSLVGYGGM